MKNNVQPRGVVDELAITEQNIQQNTGSFGGGTGILILGWPGAGKTTVAKKMQQSIEEKFDGSVLRADLEDLTRMDGIERSNGRDYLELITKAWPSSKQEIMIYEDVRTTSEIEHIAQFFDSLVLVLVESHHAARHNRLIEDAMERGDDLDDYSHDALRHRDMEAGAAGLDAIQENEFCDMALSNEGISVSELEEYAQYVARDLYLDHKYNNL